MFRAGKFAAAGRSALLRSAAVPQRAAVFAAAAAAARASTAKPAANTLSGLQLRALAAASLKVPVTAKPASAVSASSRVPSLAAAASLLPVAHCAAPAAVDPAAAAAAVEAVSTTTTNAGGPLSFLPGLGLEPAYPGGFVQTAIDGVVALHDATGLPWWGTIAAATILVRTAVLPLNLKQVQASGRLMAAQPDLAVLKANMAADKAAGLAPDSQLFAMRAREVFRKHKAAPLAAVGYAFASVPVFFTLFWCFRGLVLHPDLIPLLREGGPAMLGLPESYRDLTRADANFIAPAISTLTVMLMLELSSREQASTGKFAKMMKTGMRIMSLISFPLVCNFPLGLFMFWIPSNLFSLAFSVATRMDAVRAALGIPSMEQVRRLAAANEATSTQRVSEAAVEQARARAVAAASATGTLPAAQAFQPARPTKGPLPKKFK